MKWLGTDLESSPSGITTATVRWMNPSKDFLLACQYSALNQIVMPIGLTSDGLQGYVIEYAWRHDPSTASQYSTSAMSSVILTIRYQVV